MIALEPLCTSMDAADWGFQEVAQVNPVLAAQLENAPSVSILLEKLAASLHESSSFAAGICIGRERAKENANDYRVVLQLHVGSDLFDWFFNARSGYRAQYRISPQCGEKFNSEIIDAVRSWFAKGADLLAARELDGNFDDLGPVTISREFAVNSLVPNLSKMWACTRLIGSKQGFESVGVGGPRITLIGGDFWQLMSRPRELAWLDFKGAFLGEHGPYQPKSPEVRALKLSQRGTA